MARKISTRIVAIGGGEIGRPGTRVETAAIDRELIRLTGKRHPRLLFLPTASSDAPGYIDTVRLHFGERLGCRVDALCLTRVRYGQEEMAAKFARADIVYVGGGDTLLMMKAWRRSGVDRLILRAYRRGAVLAGLSAGSICWFRDGLSDAKKLRDERADYCKVRGLGLLKALHCPHYDVEKPRVGALRRTMEKTSGVAIALENCAALEIIDDSYRIIVSRPGARGYKIFYSRGAYYKEEIVRTDRFEPLDGLLKK